MAKIVARNTALLAGGRDISGRANTATLTFSAEAPETTCFGNVMRERLAGGLMDYNLTFGGFHDQSACQLDEALTVLTGASDWWGYYPGAATASQGGYEMIGILTDHSVENSVEGAATCTGTVTGSAFLASVTSLGYSTVSGTASTALASVDFAAAQAGTNWHFLKLFTLTGTTPSITASMQAASADAEAQYATVTDWGIASTAVNSACRTYAVTSTSCARYRRLAVTLAGTSPCATFMCSSGSVRT